MSAFGNPPRAYQSSAPPRFFSYLAPFSTNIYAHDHVSLAPYIPPFVFRIPVIGPGPKNALPQSPAKFE